jgi:hypothetical protein
MNSTMIAVESAAIAAVGYDGYYLYVQFHRSEKIYTHPGVPETVFHALMDAESKGTFYNEKIRGRYR